MSRKWEANYEPTTGKIINGVVKAANNITVLGTFTGQKYIPTTSGANLFIGHWKGKYGSGTTTPNTFFNLIIENGLVTVISNEENSLNNGFSNYYGLSSSAPVINDKTITFIYQYINGSTFSITATYNPTTKKLEGTYGANLNTSGGGTIIFEPQNLN